MSGPKPVSQVRADTKSKPCFTRREAAEIPIEGNRKMTTSNPHFRSVPEAAEILGISRNAAYAAAKQYRESGGSQGLPNLKIGGSLRVPLNALNEMAALRIPGSAA